MSFVKMFIKKRKKKNNENLQSNQREYVCMHTVMQIPIQIYSGKNKQIIFGWNSKRDIQYE